MDWKKFKDESKSKRLLNEPDPFQDRQARRQKDHNWSVLRWFINKLSEVIDSVDSYIQDKFDIYDQRFTDQLTSNTDSNEVIDARRSGVTNKKYATLGKHLDGLEDDHATIRDEIGDISKAYEYGGEGALRQTTILKAKEDLTPYKLVKGNLNLTGDIYSEANINKIYEAFTVDQLYSLYDNLTKLNPKQYHMNRYGTVVDGKPLKWYQFEPDGRYLVPKSNSGESKFDTYHRLNGSKPLLFITSGIHGDEKLNVWALYLTIKGILNGETDVDRYIKRNYEIVVLPCVNPYGFDHNQRHNERDVDINRNFPYNWQKDNSKFKGEKAFSEKSSQYVRDVRNKFVNEKSLGYKQGILFIDSHDFNFKNQDDDRIMWTGAQDYDVRNSLLKTGGLVKEKLVSMYPDLITNDKQAFFALLGSGNGYGATLNAWNNYSKIKSFSMESPAYLSPLGINQRYSFESSNISYILVRDFITQSTLDLVGKKPDDITTGFGNALSSKADDLLTVVHSIPSGKSITIGIYSNRNAIAKEMPKRADGKLYHGVLKATKSDASTSNSGTLEFVTTGFKTTHKFFSSFNKDEVREWQEVQPSMLYTTWTSLKLSKKSASLISVFKRLPNGATADLYVTPTAGLRKDLPSGITKYAKLRISRNTEKTGFVELFSFNSLTRLYTMQISQGKKTAWTEFTRGTYLTNYTSFGGDKKKDSLMNVFRKLEVGQVADLYISPSSKLKSDLPSRFNTSYGQIIIRKLTSRMAMVFVITAGHSGRRAFTNTINSKGLGTWYEISERSASSKSKSTKVAQQDAPVTPTVTTLPAPSEEGGITEEAETIESPENENSNENSNEGDLD